MFNPLRPGGAMYPYDTMYPGAGYGGYGGYGAGYGGYGAGYGTGYGAYGTGYGYGGGYGYDPAMDFYDPYEMDTLYSGGYDPYGYGGGFSRYGGMYGTGFPYTPSYYPRRGGLLRSRSVGSLRRRGWMY